MTAPYADQVAYWRLNAQPGTGRQIGARPYLAATLEDAESGLPVVLM